MALRRGEAWADRAARAKPWALERSWPRDARAVELAELQVEDIARGERDRQLREALAVFALSGAAKRWEQLRTMSGEERRNALAIPKDAPRVKR